MIEVGFFIAVIVLIMSIGALLLIGMITWHDVHFHRMSDWRVQLGTIPTLGKRLWFHCECIRCAAWPYP